MWFKNLLIYRFTKPFTLAAEELDQLLADKTFTPCGSQESSSLGWVAPINQDGAPLVHAASGYLMVCLQKQVKLLPAGVVNEEVEKKVAEIKANEERSVGRRERQDLKDAVIFELMPRAFSRTGKKFAYIDPQGGYLVVNTGSAKQAEELINSLREAVGSLPLVPLKTRNEAQQAMTHWLASQSAPANFALGGACELKDTADQSSVIRCQNLDLEAREIRNHLENSMWVSKLELAWNGGIECVIDDKLAVKKLKFGDLILDRSSAEDPESAAQRFDVDFTIMTGELSRFIADLTAALGGVEQI